MVVLHVSLSVSAIKRTVYYELQPLAIIEMRKPKARICPTTNLTKNLRSFLRSEQL